MARRRSPDPLRMLSAREHEILGRLATGLTASAIAGELGIAVPTVKRHLANIYAKLGCHNSVQASNLYHLGHREGAPRARSRG
jgi:DNA-binding CsgD family transcriptional regulator